MNKAPTFEDRRNKVGFEGFRKRLEEKGWVKGAMGIALKVFKVQYSGHAEEGNNYIKWVAILDENSAEWGSQN